RGADQGAAERESHPGSAWVRPPGIRLGGNGARHPVTAVAPTRPRSDRLELSGRVALVTGGASGQGLESARALARFGASVVIADLNHVPVESVVPGDD